MAARKKNEPVAPILRPALEKGENGIVAWRKLISPKNILLNRKAYAEKGIDVDQLTEEEVTKLKDEAADKDLMISLGGFRELVDKRGFDSVTYTPLNYGHESVSLACKIKFLPNQDEPAGCCFEGVGNASPANTEINFVRYLDAIAENRAFCRAARNFFRIESLGWDEINHDEKIEVKKTDPLPVAKLKQRVEERNFSFEDLREFVKAKNQITWNEDWSQIENIPIPFCFSILGLLKNDQ